MYKDAWLSRADEGSWERALDEGSTLRLVQGCQSQCPFYLAHSLEDQLVPLSQTRALYNALVRAGFDVQLALVEGGSHTQTLTAELKRDVMDFVKAACI